MGDTLAVVVVELVRPQLERVGRRGVLAADSAAVAVDLLRPDPQPQAVALDHDAAILVRSDCPPGFARAAAAVGL